MKTMRCVFAALLLALPAAAQKAQTQVDWYGYLRLDMAHDSAVTTGNYALYVKPHADGDAVSTLNVTGRQTRIGAHIAKGTMKGRLEFDFYGSSPENKNTVMLRYAVATIPLGAYTLEAGQTSDLISPLVPMTVNYSVAWGAGNVGYRRPQVKLIRQTPATYLGISLARNISGDLDGDTILDGDAAAVPAVMGRCALTPVHGDRTVTLGVSGHYGKCNCPSHDTDYSNWSVNADATLVVSKQVKVLAEGYHGANMGTYAGAIYNSDTLDGVHSSGGWVNLQLRPGTTPVTVSIGAGMDDVDDADLTKPELNRADVRVRNQLVFVSAFYPLTPEVVLGAEASRWATKYGNVSAGMEAEPASLRLQLSLQASF